MAGLTDKAAGFIPPDRETIASAHQAWEESMLRRLDRLKQELRLRTVDEVAAAAGAELRVNTMQLEYWGTEISVEWPELNFQKKQSGEPCSTFDSAILLYYLWKADGTPSSREWIGFRELPDGAFYHQAFQGYSGNRIARHFEADVERFERAALSLDGSKEKDLSGHAFRFVPLPRSPIAAVLWPGDEDFPTKASVLFDSSDSHYLPTDGLALLGSGLAGRLIKQDLKS
jgi:hypothetical protein